MYIYYNVKCFRLQETSFGVSINVLLKNKTDINFSNRSVLMNFFCQSAWNREPACLMEAKDTTPEEVLS